MKSQARFDQAQLIRNTDQCLAESLAQAKKESEEREARMTREIERLLNDHDSTYAQTMTGLEKRLDAKSDLMMRKLDAILNGSSWQEHSNSRERSRHANVADGTGNNARAQQSSRTNYEHRNKEWPRAAPQRPGWTNPVPPEAEATPETRLPTVPQVSSVPDLTTVSQDTTMYASMFEPLNRSLETFITKLSKSTERGERSRRTLKKPKSYKDESDGCIDTWIEVMKLHFEEENLSKKQECSALTSNLEGHFKSDCTQFWDAVADVKHPRHEEALSGVKASRARLMNEAESRKKETTPNTFTTKKVKTWPDEVVASNLETESSSPLKVDYGLAARTALQNVKQDLATKEVEQWVRSELQSTDLREGLNVLSKTTGAEDEREPKKQGLKLNVISGKTFGMTKAGTKIMSIISVAGHQVVKNLSEPSEITLVHLDIYADYLKEKDPKLDSRAVRALLTTGGPRLMKVDGHYIDVHGPYPILMNVDGINIYTKAHITDANDQVGRIYIGQEELKVRRIGHTAMLEQDAVHIGCEADLAAHVLDVQGRQLSVKGLLDTGAVVSVMPVKTWTDMGFDRSDLIPTNIRLAAANQGAIYVSGRTPIISLQLGGRHLWMSFLVVENLDESDQFILGRDFVRNFDVTIDLNDGLIRIKDPERKYEKRPLNKILINQAKGADFSGSKS